MYWYRRCQLARSARAALTESPRDPPVRLYRESQQRDGWCRLRWGFRPTREPVLYSDLTHLDYSYYPRIHISHLGEEFNVVGIVDFQQGKSSTRLFCAGRALPASVSLSERRWMLYMRFILFTPQKHIIISTLMPDWFKFTMWRCYVSIPWRYYRKMIFYEVLQSVNCAWNWGANVAS